MKNVMLEKRDHVAILTLNKPESLNALDTELLREIDEGVDSAASDPEIYALIITGTGRAFIAGADIKEMYEMGAVEMLRWARLGSDLNRKLETVELPVIAAINGFALGGGCELAMACDYRIASEKAKLGQPETTIGVTPGAGGTQRLPRLVGPGKAKELLFTGRIIDASEAERIGLVDRVVRAEELMEEAISLAERICGNAQIAVRQCKLCVNVGLETDLETGLALERQAFAVTNATEDKKIGMGAFIRREEKRFVGR